MTCTDRQLSETQRQEGYNNLRTGVVRAIRPFTGSATLPNLIDYINRELVPVVRQTRAATNETYLQVTDNAPSGNPLTFFFSTNTANADPTAGRLRLNQATQDTATVIRVSEDNSRLADVLPWLDVMAGGATTPLGVVTLTDSKNPARFVRFDLNSMADQGAYWNLNVTPIESSHDNPFVDDGAVVLGFIPGVGGSTPATVPPTSISGADGPRQFLSTTTGTTVDFNTLSSIFPGAPIYDVMAYPFNAVGNGVSDDTAAINAAIAAANTTPGVIYLGRAHRITAATTTVANNNIIIQGRGPFNGGTTVIVDTVSAVYAFTFSAQHCKIRNLWIRGAAVNLSTAVYFAGCYAAEMANVAVSQMGGALEAYCCTHTDVRYCGADDLYGPRGFYAHGAIGIAFNHAIRFEYVFCGTAFPLGTSGVAGTWASGQSITVGQLRFSNGAIWQASTSGTTGATAPNGFPSSSISTVHSTAVSDGGVSWLFAMPLNAWFCQGSFSQTFEMQDCGALQGGYGLSVEDDAPGVGSLPLFTRVHNFQVDHPYAAGVRLRQGGAAEFTQLFITSVQAGHGIDIATTYGGGYRIVGGEIFGCLLAGVSIGAGDGIIVGLKVATVGEDGFSLLSSVEAVTIADCYAVNAAGYGIDIAAGCDYLTITGNRLNGNALGTVRNTPLPGITRLVRDNVPDEPNHSTDGYENVNLAPGTYSETEVQLQLLATTHTVFINPSSNGDVIITGYTHGTSNAGKTVTWIKEGSDGRVLFRDSNVDTNDIWTPGSTDYILSQYNDAVITKQIALHRWRVIAVPRFVVRKNSTGSDFTRRRLNLIEGTGVTLTFSDDATNEEVDVTVAATAVGLTDGDKGDITVSSTGTVWTIDNDVVSDAKLRNSAAVSVIGRSANSSGDPADIAAAANDRVLARSSNTLAFQQVSNAMIRDSAALSVIGRDAGTSGAVADITANAVSNAGHVLKVENAGTGLAWGTVANQGLANMSQSRIKGRSEGAGTGSPEDLTPTEVVAVIDAEDISWTGSHVFGAALSIGGVISPVLTGDVDDWNPTGLSTATVLRITANTANRTINSIVAPSTGRLLILINISTNLVIVANNGTGTATNRIVHNMDAPQLSTHEVMWLWYDTSTTRWRVLAVAGSFNP